MSPPGGAAGTTWVPAGLATVIAVLALAGCDDVRPASVGTPFVGTWCQVRTATTFGLGIDDPHSIGFLAIGTDKVLCNLVDIPHGSAMITTVDADPGLGSGCLTLANHVRLYLTVGHGLDNYFLPASRIVGPCEYLDVQCVHLDDTGNEQPLATMRLWSPSSRATAELAYIQRHSPPPSLPTIVPAASLPVPDTKTAAAPSIPSRPRLSPADGAFVSAAVATGDHSLILGAQELIQVRGTTDKQAATDHYRQMVLHAQREILDLLDSALHGEDMALAQAKLRGDNLAEFTRAYTAWAHARP